MSATFFSPIIHLSFVSSLYCCFEKDEDRNARYALRALQQQRILCLSSSTSKSNISMATITNFFQKTTNSSSDSSSASSAQIPARLVFRDNDDSDPELLVVTAFNKTIRQVPLGKIDRVVMESSGSVLLQSKPLLDRHGKPEGPPREELRLLFIQEQGNMAADDDDHDNDGAPLTPSQEASPPPPSYIPVTNDTRNALIHHLQVLIEWERQRRIDLALDDLSDDQPNFLRKQAQTAARFAERELELRETTRLRADRKAKLVAQAGGLKYTALAMANMHHGDNSGDGSRDLS